MNKFAVFDIDGTVYREAMSFVVAEALLATSGFPEQSKLLEAAKHTYKSRGSTEAYWSYNKATLDVLETILPKITPLQLGEVVQNVLTNKSNYCYAYTVQLIQRLKREGRTLIAISGSIGNIVEPFSKSMGFDIVIASDLEIIDGGFTGKRATQTKQGKDEILKRIIAENGLTFEDSIGVGDTHRDIPMLALTDHAIAFNPNAALFEEARNRNWQIVLERKNMVYELVARNGSYVVGDARPIFSDDNQERLR